MTCILPRDRRVEKTQTQRPQKTVAEMMNLQTIKLEELPEARSHREQILHYSRGPQPPDSLQGHTGGGEQQTS